MKEDSSDEIAVEHVRLCSYIETCSMEGVKLILDIADQVGLYSDTYGIDVGSEITATFADPDGAGDEVWIDDFTVESKRLSDGVLHLECFLTATHDLKQVAETPTFFVAKQPKDILASLLPTLTVSADTFERSATYHLNAGSTPSMLIRNMAKDYGSLCYISRGTIYFKKITSLSTASYDFQLENGNPQADISFPHYSLLTQKPFYTRRLNKSYFSWDYLEGVQTAVNGSSGAFKRVSVDHLKALNNQHKAMIPRLDIELAGNTKYEPLKVCQVLFHKQMAENELDESLPQKMFITQVTHYQRGDRYLCRLELGEVNS